MGIVSQATEVQLKSKVVEPDRVYVAVSNEEHSERDLLPDHGEKERKIQSV
jgi:hypothetical protein